MQSAPASLMRRTDQSSSRSGRRPGVGRRRSRSSRRPAAGPASFARRLLRGNAPLGIEQDRARVRRQHFGDERLELLDHRGRRRRRRAPWRAPSAAIRAGPSPPRQSRRGRRRRPSCLPACLVSFHGAHAPDGSGDDRPIFDIWTYGKRTPRSTAAGDRLLRRSPRSAARLPPRSTSSRLAPASPDAAA